MASPLIPFLSFASFFFFLVFSIGGASAGDTFGLEFHHRFSDQVRRWAESRSHDLPGGWPEKGTVEYYAALAGHDRAAIRGRLLADSGASELTFAEGNATLRIRSLGFLHYAFVSLGTPNVTFLVALDTGSDLFWVPCDCQSCAPTSSASYGVNFEFSIYSPDASSTGQRVPCNSSFCELQSKCSGANSHCAYNVEYASADTSSSGVLVEDILYLTTEDAHPKVIKAPIVFGCGQVQTGSFLESAAPNGLFGLGMNNLAVPSTLSSAGLTSNSFSMCFGRDGMGRISFGDKGSSDQEETPFNLKHSHSTYNISITGVGVGNSSMNVGFSALVDSGTSFTYLADPAYTSLTNSFNAQVQDKRYPLDSSIPFEFCYSISPNATLIQIPELSLTAKGGSQFPISDPILFISDQQRHQYLYCLAVVKGSHQLNIIGQNFLTGLRIVFDRERMVLGWKKFNCYDIEDSNPIPVNPRNASAVPPAVSGGPSSYTPEATKENGKNHTQVTVLTPGTSSSHSVQLKSFSSIGLVFLLLPLAIL